MKHKTLILGILFFVFFTGDTLWAAGGNQFYSVSGPCNLKFPEDHGSHPGYRTEWWYYTGNLRSKTDGGYGYQLTFFRSQISPPGAEQLWPRPASKWRTQQIYLAHAAISDLDRGRHLQAEDMARGALGLAGVVRNETETTTVHLKKWQAKIGPEFHHLKALTDRFAIDLQLIPAKNPVLHGNAGYSRKGTSSKRASCYYSITRLKTQGSLSLDGKTIAVEGLSWMDHEFSTAPLEPGITGWDWFSLILADRSELMIYLLRQKDTLLNPASSGTFIDPLGNSYHLASKEFEVEILDTWRSPHSDALYPAQWRLTVFPLSLNLLVTPNLADQEMRAKQSTGVTYWEGSVSITGTKGDQKVEGQGYVELTGYAKPFDAPM